jgi:hypothetical protein
VRKQIGEILLTRGVEAMALARALSDRPMTRHRLCSLLISRGLLEFDEASRALAEQHGVPGVLGKHLDGRDREVARLLPPRLAMELCALPIGRGRGGELIVCTRDPSEQLRAALAPVLGRNFVLAVAPATRLEELVAETYSTMPASHTVSESIEIDMEITGPIALDSLDVQAPQFHLVGLDDARVAKDPTQSGAHLLPPKMDPGVAAGTLPPAPRKATASAPPDTHRAIGLAAAFVNTPGNPTGTPAEGTPTAPAPTAAASAPPPPSAPPSPSPSPSPSLSPSPTPRPARAPTDDSMTLGPPGRSSAPSIQPPPVSYGLGRTPSRPPPSLDETCVRLDRVTSRDGATDLAIAYLEGRFVVSVVLLVQDGVALGHRGHGLPSEAIDNIAVPLSSPSIVQVAHDTRALAATAPSSPVQDRLIRVLGQPSAPAAAPVATMSNVVAVIVTGDSIHGAGDAHDAREELRDLAEALGLAYARILIDTSKGP